MSTSGSFTIFVIGMIFGLVVGPTIMTKLRNKLDAQAKAKYASYYGNIAGYR